MTDHPGETQIWAERHTQVSDALIGLATQTAEAFRALAAIRYAAPWRERPGKLPHLVTLR